MLDNKISLTLMGVLTYHLRTLECSLILPLALTQICRHKCLQRSIQTSPLTQQKSYTKFWNPKTTFKEEKGRRRKTHPRGPRGEVSELVGVNHITYGGGGIFKTPIALDALLDPLGVKIER